MLAYNPRLESLTQGMKTEEHSKNQRLINITTDNMKRIQSELTMNDRLQPKKTY